MRIETDEETERSLKRDLAGILKEDMTADCFDLLDVYDDFDYRWNDYGTC